MNKKLLISLIIFILTFSIVISSAGLFGWNTIECDQFSIDIPSGFSTTEGWSDLDEHKDNIYLGTGVAKKGETHRYLRMYETSSFDSNDTFDSVVEKYTEKNLLVEKCQSDESNFTYAEFIKDDHFFVLTISWDNDINKLNISDDVKLVKNIMDSTKIKD